MRSNRRRGSILMLSIFFLMVLFLMSLAFFKLLPAEYQSARRMSYELNGYYAASAGLDWTLAYVENRLARATLQPTLPTSTGQSFNIPLTSLPTGWSYRGTATLIDPNLNRYRVVCDGLDSRGRPLRRINAVIQQSSEFALFTPDTLVANLDNVVIGPAYGREVSLWAVDDRWSEDFITFRDGLMIGNQKDRVGANSTTGANIDWKGNAGAADNTDKWNKVAQGGQGGVQYGYGVGTYSVPVATADPNRKSNGNTPLNLWDPTGGQATGTRQIAAEKAWGGAVNVPKANGKPIAGIYIPNTGGTAPEATAGIYIQSSTGKPRKNPDGTTVVDAEGNPIFVAVSQILLDGQVDTDPASPTYMDPIRSSMDITLPDVTGSDTYYKIVVDYTANGGQGSTVMYQNKISGTKIDLNNAATYTIAKDPKTNTLYSFKGKVNDLVFVADGEVGETSGSTVVTRGVSGMNVGHRTIAADRRILVGTADETTVGHGSLTRPDVQAATRPDPAERDNPDYLAYLQSLTPFTNKHGLILATPEEIAVRANYPSYNVLNFYGAFVSGDKLRISREQGVTGEVELNFIGMLAQNEPIDKDQFVNANSGGGNDDLGNFVTDPSLNQHPSKFLKTLGPPKMSILTFSEEVTSQY
ncbi:MAG: hypothetical protein AMXMBFR33_32600 [Candidatus Xenobia bacterium]